MIKAVGGGLALAGAVIGGHQAYLKTRQPLPIKTKITAPQENIGSGKVEAKTKVEQQEDRSHIIASEMIRQREGFESTAYNKDGKWTIGYGNTRYSTGKPVKPGDTITREQAHAEHEHHIQNVVIPRMQQSIPHWESMNHNQKAAIISFSYNVGENFYKHPNFTTISDALSHPDNWHKVGSAMKLYNKALNKKTGKREVHRGLIIRRDNEAAKFNEPVN